VLGPAIVGRALEKFNQKPGKEIQRPRSAIPRGGDSWAGKPGGGKKNRDGGTEGREWGGPRRQIIKGHRAVLG